MSLDGFDVDLKGLDGYSGKLSGDQDLVTEVSGLVSRSDVGDQSWGIVGIFVKSSYSGMLGDLNGLLGEMKSGLASGARKMTECAQTYRDIEERIANIFRGTLGGD